jgi:N-ethylmaleimide reductase
VKIGRLALPNRIAVAPMTRHRAEADGTPNALMLRHYVQRASAGLIITEGVHPSPRSRGYFYTPGIWCDKHQEAWTSIARAVHEAGGRMFMQLMHNGRIAFRETIPGSLEPVAPSAVQPDALFRGYSYRCPRPRQSYETPRPLTTAEVRETIEEYRVATIRAFEAGFDGVEVHGSSGYLPNQFLASNTNLRTDEYGGSVEARCRFVIELMETLAAVDGPDRIAIKVAPSFRFNDVHDADPRGTYHYLLEKLAALKLAYLHVSDHEEYYSYPFDGLLLAHEHYPGKIVASNGFNRKTGARAVARGLADVIAFGKAYIANPDLVERVMLGAPWAEPDPATLYTQGAQGYTDYLSLVEGWVSPGPIADPMRSSGTK